MRSVLLVLLLVVAAGCSNSVAPSSIDGRWVAPFTVPGNGFEMDLVGNGSTVSGTGTWSGEACCAGTVSVAGTINGSSVHLDITETIVPPGSGGTIISHFDGKLILNRILRGTLQLHDPANLNGQEVSYVRADT
jgi:hypothetical protein